MVSFENLSVPRLYRARVRYWPNDGSTKGMHECKILIEADSFDPVFQRAKEIAMARVWFGWNPENCEVMEATSIELPCVL